METLHPQWSGYGFTWRRDLNAIQPEQYAHGDFDDSKWQNSPLFDLVRRAEAGEDNPQMRRRLEEGPEQRDLSCPQRVLRGRRDGLTSAISSNSASTEIARMDRASSIRSSPIGGAASGDDHATLRAGDAPGAKAFCSP